MKNNETLEKRLTDIESCLFLKKEVLNIDEVVAFTGFKKGYIYKLTSMGRIPYYKPLGKRLIFNKKEIEDWLFQQKKVTNTEPESRAVTSKNGGVI